MLKLESDLRQSVLIKQKIQDTSYAYKLYAALCNIWWFYPEINGPLSFNWKEAAQLVADLRGKNEDYLTFYAGGPTCSDPDEGTVDPEIAVDLATLSWTWMETLIRKDL